jgi:hypothetical protein
MNVIKAGSLGGGVLCCRDVSTFTVPRVTFNGAAYSTAWTVYGRTEIEAATPIRCQSGSCVRLDRTGLGANYFGIYLQGIPILPGQIYRAQVAMRYAYADPVSGRAWAAIGNWSPKTNNHTGASLVPGNPGIWQTIEFDWVASGPETTLDMAIHLPPEYQEGPVDIQSVEVTERCTLSGGPCGPNQCEIGGQCFNANTSNPADYCEVCNPAECQTRWSGRPDGTYCSGVSPNVVYCAPGPTKCGVAVPRCFACRPGEVECF